jgi:hypothetical protein
VEGTYVDPKDGGKASGVTWKKRGNGCMVGEIMNKEYEKSGTW